ncbi:unnamed protein product [Rhizophagus irregularis]|uniref:Uncharacterized protein n=1 Tax=Rhizophagus irregularis TaxID=588596 RepID=A0A915YWT4_9GLOM|nr:unnamed protein product [Rhizophagus irregularis]CAB5351236.1 unnamed protein product [Rhizophagus irregularis]
MPKRFVKIVITNIFKEKFKKYCNAVFTYTLIFLELTTINVNNFYSILSYSCSIISILILDHFDTHTRSKVSIDHM